MPVVAAAVEVISSEVFEAVDGTDRALDKFEVGAVNVFEFLLVLVT